MTTYPEALRLAVRGAFRGGLTLGEVQEAEDELNRLTRQHDALLEALVVVLLEAEHTLLEPTRRKARAAIKAVEEQK